MSIRAARFGDIPSIVRVLHQAHEGSVWAETVEIDDKAAKSLITQAIQRHGKTSDGGSFVAVCEAEGEVEGFIIGCLNRVYHIGTKLSASDLFWIVTPDAVAGDGRRLFLAFERWARKNPNVVEIQCGVTDAVEDHERTSRILARRGYARFGQIYRKDVSE